jgi:hypothetical protein
MILEVSWDGLWTLSRGLSLFHGRGSWLMCAVVEFEKCPVEGEGVEKVTNHFRAIYAMYLESMKKNQTVTTCKQAVGFGIETQGF